ncbi:nickel-binding protein [Nonomuraea rubra]
MKETGLTHEQLAEVAVAQRRWAHLNPRAMYRDLITVEDVLDSRMVAYPFHLLECCLVTDGGGALIVTSAERARRSPVHLLGSGEAAESPIISQMEDFTTSKGFRLSGEAAFAEAKITHEDVDHLMVYDAFAHVPIYGLEDLGFVGRGEAGAFIAEGHTSPGGRLPLNTNGGGLSVHAHRHVRHVRHPGVGAPAPRRGGGPGAGRGGQRGAGQRRDVRLGRHPGARQPPALTWNGMERLPGEEGGAMPKFMDVHSGFVGVTEEQLRAAHERDLAIEEAEGVHFERAWLDPDSGKVFCLSSGPSKGRPSRFSAR